MPSFYKIEKENRLVLSTGSGTFTMADALSHQQKLYSDPDFDPTFSQLVDFSHVTKIELNTEDVSVLARDHTFSSGSRRAILVTSDLAFTLANMFEAQYRNAGETGIRVFRELDQALDWVLARSATA